MKHPPSSRRFFLCLLLWISVFFLGGRFLAAQTPPACDQTKHFISDPRPCDSASSGLDLNNDFLFVGKPSSAGPILVSATSGVYIFQPGQTTNNWNEVQVILDPREDGEESEFGENLYVSNDCLIVLAPLEDNPLGGFGAAIIYRFDSLANTWAFEAKIFPSDTDPLELKLFGDVSISFDHAIISSLSHTHLGIESESGAAYIFGFDGTSWYEEAELLASDRASIDFFGFSVAMVGNVAIVGAPLDDDLGINSGSVYVFKEFAGSWIQSGKITAPDGAAGDRFGRSVDFDGTTLAIGASGHDYGEPQFGAVYLFQDNALPGWEFITKLTPPPNGDGRNDFFGWALDIDGDRLAIGASGSAHVYRDTGTGWEHNARLVAQDYPLFGQGFGLTIAIHNENLVIGALSDNQAGAVAGAFYTHTNILIPDCDDNCISDTEELDAGTAFDCNANGILDVCDLTDGVSLDCNNNSIPDECEDCDNNGIADECDLNPRYAQGSGSLSPIGLGSDASFTFVSPPTRLGDVTFDFTASAELASVSDFIEVFLNSTKIGEVFNTAGTACADPPDEDQIILPLSTFESIVGTGDADVLMTAFLDPFACGGANFVTVNMSFFTPLLLPLDTNGNSVLDSCELARGDSNLDGSVNVTDLLSLLAAWGVCPAPCPEDTNLDGSVNVTDLLTLLANWG